MQEEVAVLFKKVTKENRADPKDIHRHLEMCLTQGRRNSAAWLRRLTDPTSVHVTYSRRSDTGQLSSPSTPVSPSQYQSTNTTYSFIYHHSYIILANDTVQARGGAVG